MQVIGRSGRSMRRSITSGSCPLIVLLTLLSKWMTDVQGQHLPTRDENNFHFYIDHKELFYDTKMLPDGAQVTAYIYNGTQNSYFFLVEEAEAPMSLTVNPCASAVEWQVSWMAWTEEESSGDDTDDDLLFKQRDRGNTQTTVLKPFSESGSSYATNSSLAGLYILTLRASEGATSVHIYTTTTPDSDRLHPELPGNSVVTVVSTTRHSVSLMWKPSPTATLHGQPVHYCVAVNQKQNFPSQCSAMAHVFGDVPPTVPPHAGFGFAWEKTGSDVTRRPPVAKPAPREQTSWYRCVGRKTTFTFLHGEPRMRYYFDVFAVHSATNVSSAYNGTSARTKAHARYTQLRANRPRRYYVRRFKVERSFVYNLTTATPMLLFTVQPCTTRVLVGLYRTSTLIRRLAVSRVQALAIGYPIPGLYVLTVSAPTDASFSFNVLVTSPPRLVPLPYPSLPPDASVRVSGRTSRSVNVSWHGTRERQQYCLYRRAIDVGPFGRRGSARLQNHDADVCEGLRDRLRADKVRCRNFKVRRRRKTVITETVTGLRPDTLYVFDVYVRRRGGLTLPYRRTWARTRADY